MKIYGDVMEVNGQLHTLAILPSGKEPQISLVWGLSRLSSPSESSGEEKLSGHARDQTPVVMLINKKLHDNFVTCINLVGFTILWRHL
jgi:hypothetical protein